MCAAARRARATPRGSILVSLVEAVDAITLSGGSAFGIDAPSGVAAFLRAQGRGFEIAPGAPRVPIVPGAILFDLANGGDKDWGDEPPYRALGRKAARTRRWISRSAMRARAIGATAGIYKGGLGSASAVTDDGFTVGAHRGGECGRLAAHSGHATCSGRFRSSRTGEFGGRRLKADVAARSRSARRT